MNVLMKISLDLAKLKFAENNTWYYLKKKKKAIFFYSRKYHTSSGRRFRCACPCHTCNFEEDT